MGLNWSRSEYYFALNVGVLVAAVGLLATSTRVPRWLIAGLFGAGLLIAAFSIFANRTQHNYYRQARDEAVRLRDALGLPETALATTPGMGSRRRRLAKVGTWQVAMLSALALGDLAGLVYSIDQEIEKPAVQIAAFVRTSGPATAQRLPLSVSKDGEVVARSVTQGRKPGVVSLPPDDYVVWAMQGRRVCRRKITVRDEALQTVLLDCGFSE